MHAAVLLLVLAGTPLESAIGKVVPTQHINGFATWALPGDAVRVKGYARTHEGVDAFMRAIATIVSTPKGLGRVVERSRSKSSVRVELFERRVQLDFSTAEVREIRVELVDLGAQGSFELHVQ